MTLLGDPGPGLTLGASSSPSRMGQPVTQTSHSSCQHTDPEPSLLPQGAPLEEGEGKNVMGTFP